MLDYEEVEQFCVGMQMGKRFEDKESQKDIKWMLENDVLLPRDKERALNLYKGPVE